MMSEQEFATIAALDLDPIKVKLMHQESGEGWSLERATAMEFEYRRFLYLMKMFPHEQIAPLFDVDIRTDAGPSAYGFGGAPVTRLANQRLLVFQRSIRECGSRQSRALKQTSNQ